MALEILTKIGTYINPLTLGQYPNGYITYSGDKHFGEQRLYMFKFTLLTENVEVVQDFFWRFDGVTFSGNTIQDEGEIILSAGTSGATTTDFVTATIAGVDYGDPQHQIVRLPKLSYDDIDTYFILGGKKESVRLPAGEHPKRLVKWLFLNSIYLNGELLDVQFEWA